MSRENESTLLRALATRSQQALADAIGRDQSYISKFQSDNVGLKWSEVMALLDAVGLELFDSTNSRVIVDREEYEAFKTLARRYIEGMR